MTTQRVTHVHRSSMDDFHEALAWALQQADTFGKGARLDLFQLYPVGRQEVEDGPIAYTWTAEVRGTVEEEA